MLSFHRKALSLVMSIVLAVGLCPGLAFAGKEVDSQALFAASVSGCSVEETAGSGTSLVAAEGVGFQRKALSNDCEIVSISAGDEMSAAVRSDGTLWTWGAIAYANITQKSLGLAEGSIHNYPNMVLSGSAQSVSCSDTIANRSVLTTAVLKNDNSLWIWGGNSCGSLGDGSTEIRSTPTKILEDVVSYDVSGKHSAAVTSDGSLYMWGDNTYGQLGTGTTESVNVPTKIELDNVVAVSLGLEHSAALKSDGSLWLWGRNDSGQIGNGSTSNSNTGSAEGCSLVPEKRLEDVKAVSLGDSHSAAIKTDGTLWTWGDNSNGRLGNGTTIGRVLSPTQVVDVYDLEIIEVSGGSNAAIKADGTLLTWGRNSSGQLGDKTITDSSTPSPITFGDLNVGVNSVAFSGTHAVAVKQDGTIWTWGSNNFGQLGNGSFDGVNKPQQVHLGRVSAAFTDNGIENRMLDITWDDSVFYQVPHYDQNLAIGGIILSEAAYSNQLVLNQLGFSIIEESSGGGIDEPGYVIGYRATYDFGEPHIEIVMAIKGSTTGADWITNIKGIVDGFDGPTTTCYNALRAAKTGIANALSSKGISMNLTNTKYFFTGHSLGGACAGKLALKTVNNNVTSVANTYAYTFAAPNYTSGNGKLDCSITVPGLFNIVNDFDTLVPNIPTFKVSFNLFGSYKIPLSKAGTTKRMHPTDSNSGFIGSLIELYGNLPEDRYEFTPLRYSSDDDEIEFLEHIKPHMPGMYLACLLNLQPYEKDSGFYSRLNTICCPVDIEVYDADGELCGSIVDGVATNVEHSAVCVAAVDDDKYVSLPTDGEYTIKYIGTDTGTMKVEDQIYNTETGEVVSEEVFQNVVLEKGKTFTSLVDGSAETVNTELYVLDSDSEPVAIVQNDGTEAPLPSPDAETTGGGDSGNGDSTSGIADGETSVVGGATYGVVSNTASTAVFKKAPKAKKSVTVPAAVTIVGKSYKVVGIAKNAFKGTKAKKVTIKTPLLTKSSVKGCFKGAKKLKTVKVPKAKKKAYKKIFAKKVCGKKVKVK